MKKSHHSSGVIPKLLLGASLYAALSGIAMAGQLIYTPIDPSFGGNPANGSYLMGIATQQESKYSQAGTASIDLSSLTQDIQDLTTAVGSLNNSIGGTGTTGGVSTSSLAARPSSEASRILSPGLSGIAGYDPTTPGVR